MAFNQVNTVYHLLYVYACMTISSTIVLNYLSVLYTLGKASITNGMATVTVSGLECGVTYTIIAGGLFNGNFAGPRSLQGNITESCLSSAQRRDEGDF